MSVRFARHVDLACLVASEQGAVDRLQSVLVSLLHPLDLLIGVRSLFLESFRHAWSGKSFKMVVVVCPRSCHNVAREFVRLICPLGFKPRTQAFSASAGGFR